MALTGPRVLQFAATGAGEGVSDSQCTMHELVAWADTPGGVHG